jgi:hypothetical protein
MEVIVEHINILSTEDYWRLVVASLIIVGAPGQTYLAKNFNNTCR